MSHIKWTDLRTGQAQYISGSERAHLGRLLSLAAGESAVFGNIARTLNVAVERAPVLRLAARIHGQCEIGAWVGVRDRAWLADRIRECCESTVRVTDPDPRWGSEHSECVFRVGMSTYGDGGGWWRLSDWLRQPGGRVIMSYSVCEDRRTCRPEMRMQPAGWDSYRFGGDP